MYKTLTVAREYESGGDRIAALLAERLGWKLIDSALIDEVANLGHVEPRIVRKFDECVDSWMHRIGRRALTHGAFEGVAVLPETTFFDAETMALLARSAIERAWQAGKCVIVGRGSQCVLQDCADVFHVFLYAPSSGRSPADEQRARYIQMNFGQEWRNPHLYDLMIDSQLGEDRVVAAILAGMGYPS